MGMGGCHGNRGFLLGVATGMGGLHGGREGGSLEMGEVAMEMAGQSAAQVAMETDWANQSGASCYGSWDRRESPWKPPPCCGSCYGNGAAERRELP